MYQIFPGMLHEVEGRRLTWDTSWNGFALKKYSIFVFHNGTKRYQAEQYLGSKNVDTFKGVNNTDFPN